MVLGRLKIPFRQCNSPITLQTLLKTILNIRMDYEYRPMRERLHTIYIDPRRTIFRNDH